jgi:predicted amidohydrolase
MKRKIKISTIGYDPFSADKDCRVESLVGDAIKFLKGRIDQVLPDHPDLIVLPECCDRPACSWLDTKMQVEYYKARGERVLNALQEVAKNNNTYITYPAVRILPDNTLRNSIQIIDRRGKVIGIYNKNHLVIEEYTQKGILFGKEAKIIKCDFGRIGFAICFDLNFDELRLQYVKAKPDLIIFSSMYHGGLMQRYWAYSCRAYFVGAIGNRALRSAIINPVGEIVAQNTNYFDFITTTINLDYAIAHLDYNWEKLTALKSKYGKEVIVHDPSELGSVLITSETPEKTAVDMCKEFEIELLDDYFARALRQRHSPGCIENC